jgi:hypothetical protein
LKEDKKDIEVCLMNRSKGIIYLCEENFLTFYLKKNRQIDKNELEEQNENSLQSIENFLINEEKLD